MNLFLIQTVDGEIKHDFSYHLVESIRFNNWFYNEKLYSYLLSDELKDVNSTPVGSVEFVTGYLSSNLGIERDYINPIQIPEELLIERFLKRKVCFLNKKEIVPTSEPLFVKSISKYKGFTDIITENKIIPDDRYFVSEVVDIDSEWRSFVFQNELVGLQNYSGDFTLFPDVSLINEMIKAYKDSPPAYTLDVGVNKDGTFVIEVHPFFSCGLYGFQNYKLLAPMFSQTFNWLLKIHTKIK